MKSFKNTFVLLLITLFAISCSNDDNPVETQKVIQNRISKEVSGNTTKTYSYNSDNQLIKIIQLSNNGGSGAAQAVVNYTYTNGKVSLARTDYTGASSFGSESHYTYDDAGKIASIDMYTFPSSGSSSYTAKITFDYTSPNIIKETVTNMSDGSKSLSVLNLVNGNVTINSTYTNVTAGNPNGTLNNSYVFSNFDTKKSPYTSLPQVYRYPSLSVNNEGKYETSGVSITYAYQYNEDGFPIKRTSSTNEIITYEYERI